MTTLVHRPPTKISTVDVWSSILQSKLLAAVWPPNPFPAYLQHHHHAIAIASAIAITTATTTIKIPRDGNWRLWVRSKDFAATSGGRSFNVAVNGKASAKKFGAHGNEGFAWQDGGVFSLPAGNTKLELIDSSQYFPRCDRILLTRDLRYTPNGPGGKKNIEHVPADGKIW